MNKEKVRTNLNLSKELSYLLRHCPESKHLTMDKHGWVKISELITNAPEFTMENIKSIVETDSKTRYSISDDGEYIRANQGHSIPVDLELKPVTPPEVLYHGTVDRFLDSIKENGLIKGKRQYIHLSKDVETARAVGSRRRGNPVILEVNSKMMKSDGFKFYCSENGVWLVQDPIPWKYLKIYEK